MKFIAKPQTYFKAGSEVKHISYELIDNDKCKYGMFQGETNDGKITLELCAYDEFDIININN